MAVINPQELTRLIPGGNDILPGFPPSLPFTQGKIWHVKPRTGNDRNNSGLNPDSAVKTLQRALALAQADRNDVVLLYGEGNAAASCTARVPDTTSTIDWNKDLVHLIGVNSGVRVSPRSRIAFTSDFDNAANLFTVSANGCYIANIQFFAGVDDANPTGAVKVTGNRNYFERVHFAGIGHATNDIENAYSLFLDGGCTENEFHGCTIGLDTIGAGSAANADLRVDGGASRNSFYDCEFIRQVDHATNYAFVELEDATAIDRYLRFVRCNFTPFAVNYTPVLAAVMKIPALTQGFIQVAYCAAFSSDNGAAIKWDANDNDKIQLVGPQREAEDTLMQGVAV